MDCAAWQLLTTPCEELRDPTLALEFALQANALSHFQDASQLDTLALASFQTGDVQQAIEYQKRALSLLSPDAADRTEYEVRLAEFEAAGAAAEP